MKHLQGEFSGQKQLSIHFQGWLPEQAVKAVVLVVHGLGEHGGRYAHVAERLVAEGCAVYAIDHRGHGRSGGPRGFVDRFANMVADLDQLVVKLANEFRGRPLFMLGHSMGGAVSLSYAIKHQQKLSALILSGPAVVLAGAPAWMKPVVELLSAIAPKLGVFAVDPSLVSRDPAAVADYAADPLNFHGKVPARTLAELVGFVGWLPAVLPEIKLPLLIQHGADDRLASPAGGELVFESVSSKDKTFHRYDGLYHEIYNELPADRARVLDDLAMWIRQHLN